MSELRTGQETSVGRKKRCFYLVDGELKRESEREERAVDKDEGL
jgi:hypothetical protein